MDAITVSQLNRYIKLKLDNDIRLKDVSIKGEISNFTRHSKSGHLYFSLKDEDSVVKAVMFRGNAEKVRFDLKDGQNVIVRGQVSGYERDGIYQLYAIDISLDGSGDLALKFELLKEKLRAEGLFDEKNKKAIPKYPERIGIITSPTGAAIKDILNVIERRFPAVDITLYPAIVQGDSAAKTLIDGVEYFNIKNNVDVILIGRGGGSAEDLWCFNDEKLAYAIFNSSIPIISCVGHEVDFTISDFVADVRAATPSVAAELCVPDENSVRFEYSQMLRKAEIQIENKISVLEKRLGLLNSRPCLKNAGYYILNRQETLDRLMSRPVLKSPDFLLEKYERKLVDAKKEIEIAFNKKKNILEINFAKLASKLDAMSPLKVLSRGYALASVDNKTVTAKDLNINDEFAVMFSDGRVTAIVKERE